MMNIMNYFILLVLVLFMLTMMLYLISYKSIIDREKMSPFECSFDPLNLHEFHFQGIFL